MNNSTPDIGRNSEPEPVREPSAPQPGAILAELELIARSDLFAGAARQQRLLRHLVTKGLEGTTGELKEYTLGVEVFDRGDDFDPRLDPIVRVEASRLRSRLQKYYDGPGAADPVRISLPRGAYVPAFAGPAAESIHEPVPAIAVPPSVSAQETVALAGKQRFPYRNIAAIVSVLLLAGVGWLVLRPEKRGAPPTYPKFRRLTNDEVLCTSPTYSADGKSIAYARRDAGTWHLYERVLATSAWTALTPGSTDDDYQPAWSPNGQSIAFRSERDGGGLFLLDTHNRKVNRLTSFGYNPTWAPDSERVAFSTATFDDPVENSADAGGVLDVVDLKTREVRQMTARQNSFAALQPAWSPHGRRIAYWDTDANGDRDIWTLDAEARDPATAHPVPVTHDAWTDWSPAWSPDGNYLYFSSDRGGAMNLWRIRIDEDSGKVRGDPEPVTTPSSYSGWVAFAPSGKQFAYVRRIPFSQLYKAPFDPVKGIDMAARVQLTSGERSMHEPDMSPDGQWIVVRVQDPDEDLALVRPDGTGLRRLTNDVYTERNPHWSPDGKQIVFISNRSHRFDLWSIYPDGTHLRQLTANGAMEYAWSPDGTLTGYPASGAPVTLDPPGQPVKDWGLPPVFRPLNWAPNREAAVGRLRSNAFGRGSLFIYTPESDDYWEIAPRAGYPSDYWLENGKKLLYSRSDGIYLADLHTHQVKEELPTAHSDVHAHFTVSNDGRTFFFVESDDEQDIWVGSE